MNISVLLFVLLAGYQVTFVQSEGCPDPEIDVAPTLDPKGEDSFQEKKFNKVLKKNKKLKPVKAALDSIEKAVTEIISDTTDSDSGNYPACVFERACNSITTKINYWSVVGQNCWLVEPLAWVECVTKEPSRDCGDPETGYTCKQTYTMQTVWVYCPSEKKNPVTQITVAVATGCQAMMHDCSARK